MPQIKGIENRKVLGGAKLHHSLKTFSRFFGPHLLRWLTRFWMPVGKKVVIIGGGIQGCELAEFLTWRGRQVTIVDTDDVLGKGMVDVLLDLS
jgi:NADPH-dependent 2,4-dienoyl-CoA reductase/sulfur reductase-like enzyme